MKYMLAVMALVISVIAHSECIPKSPRNAMAQFYDVNPLAMTKAQFNADLDLLERVYGPEFAMRGCPLVVNREWDDPTPNAFAHRESGACHITMMGGLARAPHQTRSGQLYVACHELGHHIAGAPLYPADWASNEGQSDYFAAFCMKRLGRSSASARLALSHVLAAMNDESLPTRLPRSNVHVSRHYNSHPAAKCRLDIMDAGAACGASGRFSPRDPRVGACHRYSLASPYSRLDSTSRPRCFYKP